MRKAVAVAAVAMIAALAGALISTAQATARCSVTVTVSGPAFGTGKLQVSPAAPSVAVGDCLSIRNKTNPAEAVGVTITRSGKTVYARTVDRGQTASGRHGFAPRQVGRYALTATATQPLGFVVHGHATITAQPGPTTSPTGSGSPTPTASSASSGGPTPTPSTSASAGNKHRPRPHATGIKLPPLPPLPSNALTAPIPKGTNPVVAPGPSTAAATTESATPVAVAYHGPIEPGVDNSRGLPIAIGVLVVLGIASGWGRALLATAVPVDKRSRGDHRI
jgi:hypothetical protein